MFHCNYSYYCANSEVQKPTDMLRSIILKDLLGNRTVLKWVQQVMVCDPWMLDLILCVKVPCFTGSISQCGCVILKMAVNIKDFYGNSGNTFAGMAKWAGKRRYQWLSLVICVPLPEKHISLVICVPLPGKHIWIVICVPYLEKTYP